jgi:AcrR family transcriptional regulator
MENIKSKILQAASELFLEGGASALSVRAIASRAGISTIGIYSHFQGKQGILDALYVEGFERVTRAMRTAEATLAPSAAVAQACQNYLDTAEEFSAHYQLIFGQQNGYQPSESAQLVGVGAFKVLTELVGTLLPGASKAARQDAAIAVWSVVHGFVGLRQHAVGQLVAMHDWKQRAMRTIEWVVRGIVASDFSRPARESTFGEADSTRLPAIPAGGNCAVKQ